MTADTQPRSKPRMYTRSFPGDWAVAAGLVALCWFAHFAGSSRMGFYEDDHAFAVPAMTDSAADLAAWVRLQASTFPLPQGRPLGFALGRVLPWIGYHFLGGVPGMYRVGFAVVAADAVGFYALLRRCQLPPGLPVAAAVGFALFPPDTTRPFLCHDGILFPAVGFALTGCHFYLSGRAWRWVGGSLALVATLLTYEAAALPVVVFPLLAPGRWDRAWAKRIATQTAVTVTVTAAVFVARRGGGESRAALADLTVVHRIVAGTVIGNTFAWQTCVGRGLDGVRDALSFRGRRPAMLLVAIGVAAGVWWDLRRPRSPGGWGRAVAFAMAGSAVAYVFCFSPPHYPPTFRVGRLTSTYLAATVPMAMAMGLVTAAVGRVRFGRGVAVVLAAGSVAAVSAAAVDVRVGYVQVWDARRRFWGDVLRLCPDLTDGTVVVCDGFVRPPSLVMAVNSWSDTMVLGQCYQFPPFGREPMLCCPTVADPGDWRQAIRFRDGRFEWPTPPVGLPIDAVLEPGNVILLHVGDDNAVSRATRTIVLAGRPFRLREPTETPAFPTRPLYDLVRP